MRLLDRLRDEGRISAAQYESFYHSAKRTGERIEDAVLESGAVSEPDLLKLIAASYKTRFVSTERLAKADVDKPTLDKLPRRLAERFQCAPILFDARAQALSVVAYDLDSDVGPALQQATGVREVRVFVARPAAVKAAIRRLYANDPQAFASLLGTQGSLARNPASSDAIRLDTLRTGEIDIGFDDRPTGSVAIGGLGGGDFGGFGGGLGGLGDLGGLGNAPARPPAPARSAPQIEPATIEMPHYDLESTPDNQLEMLNVLVTLIEAPRAELRGHSSHVARMTKQIVERLSLPKHEADAILVAAYLHDIGKTGTYHLTALNVSRSEPHRAEAQRTYLAPTRTFESARLSELTQKTLAHLFERYDGQGFPDRLSGKDIPIGARVIAAVDTFSDLTLNPKNPYRRTLTPKEAVDVVRQLGSSLFDPLTADLLKQAIGGSNRGMKRVEGRTRVLVVDPYGEETTMLELRLAEAGHTVVVTRDREDAQRALASEARFDLVISEFELKEEDGLVLLDALRAGEKTKDLPFIFLTRRADRESVARGFEHGAADFLVKPVSAELVVAKTAQIIEAGLRKRGGGLAGNLRDVSLPDVIQTLGNGRKTGRLRLVGQGQVGDIEFLEGQIANAAFGTLVREDAFYAMISLSDGDFAFDASIKPAARSIQASTEALLLEGMRRMDEATL